jgi:dTDP-4-amino-4,6-dideoxygalactose transaminase
VPQTSIGARVPAPVPAIPMSGPDITEVEIDAVVSALRSGCLSLGPCLAQFEETVANLVGSPHAAGVSSGTAGLHLTMVAAGVGSGDLVITSPFSFIASANCILYEHGIPVFVDVDPATGNLDSEQVVQAVSELAAGRRDARRWLPPSMQDFSTPVGALRAIVPVHAFGQPADMDPILKVAAAYDIPVVEDACEAIGATYKGRHVGGLGDAGVFAFYPNKQVTTGEGGMVVTRRPDWAARFNSLRNQGRDTMDAWLRHDRLGYNYRLSELSAALGSAQLSRIDVLLAARERVARRYCEQLSGIAGLELPVIDPNTTRMSWFAFVVRLAHGIDRQAVIRDLAAAGVPTRTYFSPIHLQPFYQARFGYQPGDFPVTEALGATSLALPFSSRLSNAEVDHVCDRLGSLVSAAVRVRPLR